MLRLIREIRPRWIVGENVYGITNWSGGLVFEEVCADLEAEGYEVQPIILPAIAVDAPHRRDRVWFIAHRTNSGVKSMRKNKIKPNRCRYTANSNSRTARPSGKGRSFKSNRRKNNDVSKKRGRKAKQYFRRSNVLRPSSNSTGKRLRGEGYRERKTRQFNQAFDRINWENFPTEQPVRWRDDGFSERLDLKTILKIIGRKVTKAFNAINWWHSESIKAFGNAVVPHMPYEIFKIINIIENEEDKNPED